MSDRIVILGPHDGETMQAAEIPPMDAGAFLNGDNWRVSLTLFSGPLANATVLCPKPIDRPITAGEWRAALLICPQAIPFEIQLPIETADYGATARA